MFWSALTLSLVRCTQASAVTCVALVIQITVTSRPPIYVARLLLGLANGFFVNSVILWLGESAPTHLRGSFVALFQVFQGLGGTLGAGISKALSTNLTKHSYQIQLATLFVVPLWFLVYPWFMPESPRWLVTRGRPDDALKSLRRIRGRHYMASEVEVELAAIQEAVEAERELPSRRNDPRLLPRYRQAPHLAHVRLRCAARQQRHPAAGQLRHCASHLCRQIVGVALTSPARLAGLLPDRLAWR